MLRHPHTGYSKIFVYYFDRMHLPPIDHPDLIGTWIEDGHTLYFFHTCQDLLTDNLARQTGAKIIYRASLDYRDWEAGVVVRPFRTRHLQVRPVWELFPWQDREKKEIVLDPSVVFGSGFHPTTRLCLEALEQLMLDRGKNIRMVSDLGAGTGLLSIAAVKLGAEAALGVDNNPLACAVAEKNIRLNDCGEQVIIKEGDIAAELPDFSCSSLVIANLYKGLLKRLFADESFWMAGYYLISGFMPAMEPELLSVMPQKGIRLLERAGSDMWRIWVLERTDGVD